MEYKHLFGPVPSRRIGISLGVDVVPHKVCSFNCVYCECGPTTELTVERREYVPIFRILEELKDFLNSRPKLDFITFSGAGEPLLNKGIGGIVKFIKQNYPVYNIALFTNSSMLTRQEIRNEVLDCDLIIPSLDAVSVAAFNKVNRPAAGRKPIDIVTGLCKLREEFKGTMWLEIFVVPGGNDSEQELDLLSKAAERIGAHKIQLNFLDRPSTENWVRAPKKDEIKRIMGYFRRITVEVVPYVTARKRLPTIHKDIIPNILSIIKRRPSTVEDISNALGIHIQTINKYLDQLLEKGEIEFKTEERGIFFRIKGKR
jgi:wyosine [tRNA(Phe)-imidazoG37] synthetase (radical SAM superfamily)